MPSQTVDYHFILQNGHEEHFHVVIATDTLTQQHDRPLPTADWTRLDRHACHDCPLPAQGHCPAAQSLLPVITRFSNVVSHDPLFLQVSTPTRTVSQHTTAQQAISSLQGLLIATSTCPHTEFLKPMARFHLPLADIMDTLFRAAGSYLLEQYFLQHSGNHNPDWSLHGLAQHYTRIHELNCRMAERIRAASQQDSSVNAVVLLDSYASLMPLEIEEKLPELQKCFPFVQKHN